MVWNGTGTFNPPLPPDFPAVAGELISSTKFNNVITQLSGAFSNTVPRDGQAPLTGDILGGGLYSIKQLPAATESGMAVRYDEFILLQTTVNGISSGVEPFVLQSYGVI